jgi:hypothetical protein
VDNSRPRAEKLGYESTVLALIKKELEILTFHSSIGA